MHEKPHQNPMGFESKSPTPGVFQSQFPTPMGDGGGDPMGPPWGLGVGVAMLTLGCIWFPLTHKKRVAPKFNSNFS